VWPIFGRSTFGEDKAGDDGPSLLSALLDDSGSVSVSREEMKFSYRFGTLKIRKTRSFG